MKLIKNGIKNQLHFPKIGTAHFLSWLCELLRRQSMMSQFLQLKNVNNPALMVAPSFGLRHRVDIRWQKPKL